MVRVFYSLNNIVASQVSGGQKNSNFGTHLDSNDKLAALIVFQYAISYFWVEKCTMKVPKNTNTFNLTDLIFTTSSESWF